MTLQEFNARAKDPTDEWLMTPPLTPQQLAAFRKSMKTKGKRACDGCALAPRCSLVFDDYNTDGDCLLEK